jgi:hypothetical protein
MITFASVFLSHSSADKPLVEAVARELGRRGILAWMDKDELYPGLTLTNALAQAIQTQTIMAAFLSPESIKSPWVDDELEIAFKAEEAKNCENFVIPICMDSPLKLINSHPRLQTRLMLPTGDRINRLYIVPERSTSLDIMARDIADQILPSVFIKLKINRDVLIYIDQRGNGQRKDKPEIPPNLRNDLDVAALVFRPDRGERSRGETLFGDEWEEMCRAMRKGLDSALGTARWIDSKRLYILGNAQSGFFYFLGNRFNRNTSARLYCQNIGQPISSNASQRIGATQLAGGNAHCESTHPGIDPLIPGSKHEVISLLLGQEKYLASVRQFMDARGEKFPLLFVKSDWFSNSDQTMAYIADVVALLSRLRSEHSVRTVCLYNSLPVFAMPLLSANLLNEMDNIVFMEYRSDLQNKNPSASETYAALKL